MKITKRPSDGSNIRRYTKRCVAGLLSAVFLAACCPIAFAAEEPDGLYVSTEMCPQAVIDHAKEDFYTMNFQDWGVPGTVKLGTPFVLNVQNNDKLYYFPILNADDEIVMTYRAYKNGDSYGGIFSEALVDELSEFETTTRSDPVKISLNPQLDIVLQSNRHVAVSKSNDPSADTEAVQLKSSAANGLSKTPVNVLSVLCTNTENGNIQLRGISDNRWRDLPVTIREIQPDGLPWCAGYVTAMIVSYKTKGVYYARDVANYAGVTENEGIPNKKLIEFAKSKGLSPRFSFFDLSTNSIANHIDDNDPIYVGAFNISNESHALALTGYQKNINTGKILRFRIWNPWYTSFETMGLDQIYVAKNGEIFRCASYMIDW